TCASFGLSTGSGYRDVVEEPRLAKIGGDENACPGLHRTRQRLQRVGIAHGDVVDAKSGRLELETAGKRRGVGAFAAGEIGGHLFNRPVKEGSRLALLW